MALTRITVAAALLTFVLSLGPAGVSWGADSPGLKGEASPPYLQMAALTKTGSSAAKKSGKG